MIDMAGVLFLCSVSSVRKQCDVACSLDCGGELSLVHCAGTGDTSGQDLSAFGSQLAQLHGILVADIISPETSAFIPQAMNIPQPKSVKRSLLKICRNS